MTHSEQIVLVAGTVDDVEAAVAIDDAASALYTDAGIVFDFPVGHPMAAHERVAWRVCAAHDGLLFATTKAEGARIGFIVMGTKDGDAYLEQISVLPAHMRRGVGTVLMTEAVAWSVRRNHRAVWLTTYDHLVWNRPYYERFGFAVVPAADCGPEIAAVIAFQRTYLPEPDRRVAMRKTL